MLARLLGPCVGQSVGLCVDHEILGLSVGRNVKALFWPQCVRAVHGLTRGSIHVKMDQSWTHSFRFCCNFSYFPVLI